MYISLDNAVENTVNNLNRNFSVDDIENHMKFNIFYEKFYIEIVDYF